MLDLTFYFPGSVLVLDVSAAALTRAEDEYEYPQQWPEYPRHEPSQRVKPEISPIWAPYVDWL